MNVGLPEIAAEAGVARSTIYTAFGSREGLMFAVAEDLLQRSGFDRVGAAFPLPDAVAALETSLRESAQFYAREHAVGRAMFRLAPTDRDPGAADAAAELVGRRAASHLLPREDSQRIG